jgi:hypothetical protein
MRPTAAALIEKLREPGEAYEKLAARLPISLSTVYRWKKGDADDFKRIAGMLEDAGWLDEAAIRRDLLAAAGDAAEESRPGAERATERIRDRRRSPAREETGT